MAFDPRQTDDSGRLREYLARNDLECPKCGYQCRGLQSGRCPECAWVLRWDDLFPDGSEAAEPNTRSMRRFSRTQGMLVLIAIIGWAVWVFAWTMFVDSYGIGSPANAAAMLCVTFGALIPTAGMVHWSRRKRLLCSGTPERVALLALQTVTVCQFSIVLLFILAAVVRGLLPH